MAYLLLAKANVNQRDNTVHLSPTTAHKFTSSVHQLGKACGKLPGRGRERSVTVRRLGQGRTPLHEAALHGHLETVRALLDNKAEVNAREFTEVSAARSGPVKAGLVGGLLGWMVFGWLR